MARKKRGKNPIHINPKHKGLLHEDLGMARGTPIPMKMLEKAKHSSNPAEQKRATFAINAKTKFHHRGRKK